MISFIIPTTGRASLADTLRSVPAQADDEIIIVGPVSPLIDPRARVVVCDNVGDWGATERTRGMRAAEQPYLAFMDDDDRYAPEAGALLADAITRTPDVPILFRLAYPNGCRLWQVPVLRCGNVSTQMIVIPNDRTRLGTWTPRREGDFDFLSSMGWPVTAIVWRPEILAYMGHNDVPIQ